MRWHVSSPLGIEKGMQKRHLERKGGRVSGLEAGLGSVVPRRPQVHKRMLRSYIDACIVSPVLVFTKRMERIKVSADPTGRTVT